MSATNLAVIICDDKSFYLKLTDGEFESVKIKIQKTEDHRRGMIEATLITGKMPVLYAKLLNPPAV